ncbi:MAG TPA: AMP-binding protein [Trebonia sp.]
MHLTELAREHGDKPAVIMADSGASLSYAELERQSNKVAQLFRARGLRPGDHIAVLMENRLEFFPVVWAAQRCGLRIADAEGLDAVSMRRVAAELGIANMSLYNYVPSRDHLAQLMTDQLAGEYTFPATPTPDPRAAIAGLAGQARNIAERHPWLAGLMQRPMPPGPNALRYLDYFLGLLAGSRLDTGAKMEVIAMISGFATRYGALQAILPAEQAGTASTVQHNVEQVQALARAAASGRYPNLAAALMAGGPPRSQDDIFASCIDRLIDLAEPGCNGPRLPVPPGGPPGGRNLICGR